MSEPSPCGLCEGAGYIDLGPTIRSCLCDRVRQLERALEQAIVDLKGIAADGKPEARKYVRSTAAPRALAILNEDRKAIRRLERAGKL